MIRFFLRSTGFVLLAAAIAALIVDGTRSIAAKQVMLFSVSETANWLMPAKLALVQRGLEEGGMRGLRPVLDGLLAAPTWLLIGVAGSVLLFAGRRPPPKVGFSSRP